MTAHSTGAWEATTANVVDELRTSNRLLAVMATRGMEQRQAVLLLDAVGLQPKQIAAVLGVTPNSVSVALHRARKAAQVRARAETPALGQNDVGE